MKTKNFIPLNVAIILVIIISALLAAGIVLVNYANQMNVFEKSMSEQADYYVDTYSAFFNTYKFEKENTTNDLAYIVHDVKHIESISINFINSTKYGDGTIELYEFASYEYYVDYLLDESKTTFDDIRGYDMINNDLAKNAFLRNTGVSKIKLSDSKSWFIVMPLVYNDTKTKETYIIGTCAMILSWSEESENYTRFFMNSIYGASIFLIVEVFVLLFISRIFSKKNRQD